MIRNLLFIVTLAALGFLFSCKPSGKGGPKEGIIEYELKVLQNNNPILTTDLLPSVMTARFKNDAINQQLSAGMGMFSTSFISDYKSKKVYQVLNMLGKKYACEADSIKLKGMLAEEPEMEFIPSEETKMIAGYKCKKVTAKYKTENKPSFDVYYTEELNVENPNFYFNYFPVKGVLMQFVVTRYLIEMELTAKKVTNEKVEDSFFTIDPSSKMVTIEEMNSYFTGGK